MLPGFVTLYKDDNYKTHLYFYPGIDEDNIPIYNDIDLSNIQTNYSYKTNNDNSIDIMFHNNDISKITCKLVKHNGEIDIKKLETK